MVCNELFLVMPFEHEVLCIWYPKSSVGVRLHFRVRVQTPFRWQMEEPGRTRFTEHRILEPKWRGLEGPTVYMERTERLQTSRPLNEGTFREEGEDQRRCGGSGEHWQLNRGDWSRPEHEENV